VQWLGVRFQMALDFSKAPRAQLAPLGVQIALHQQRKRIARLCLLQGNFVRGVATLLHTLVIDASAIEGLGGLDGGCPADGDSARVIGDFVLEDPRRSIAPFA
jgi:hypothetical protein